MSTEITPAIEAAERALVETWHGTIGRAFHPTRVKEARATVAAALPVECHEEVQGWSEDASHPCNEPAVAYREDKWDGGGPPYPVCAKHATPDLVPLRAAILGEA